MDEKIILTTNRVRNSKDFTKKSSTYSKEKALEKFRNDYEVHFNKVLREVRKSSPRSYDAIDIYLKKNNTLKSHRNSPLPHLKPRIPYNSELSPLKSHNKPHNTTLPYFDAHYTPKPPKEQPSTKRPNLMYKDQSTISNTHQSRKSSPKGNSIINTLDEIKQLTMNMKEIIGNQTQKIIETSPSHLNKSVEFESKTRMRRSRRNTKNHLNRSIDTYNSKPLVPLSSQHPTRLLTSLKPAEYIIKPVSSHTVDLNSIQQYFESFHHKSKMLLNQLEKNVLGSNRL